MIFQPNKSSWQKEWEVLQRKETAYAKKKEIKTESKINQLLEKKVPDKLRETLSKAFEKAFSLVFEKGTTIIEKTYGKKAASQQYEVDQFAAKLKQDRKSLKVFSRRAGGDSTKNLLLSGVEGIGLGALGIGLPDIPLFTGMVCKSLYETALRYGYDYESTEERYFLLKLMEAALSSQEEYAVCNQDVESFIEHPALPLDYEPQKQIEITAAAFSKELLYMKFLQGIPLVGVAGGVYDAVYLGRILEYAKMKYQKRFLMKQKQEWSEDN